MGIIKHRRPVDLRTGASTDMRFDVIEGTTGGHVATTQYRRNGITTSTAGSTALSARGVIEMGSSSTSAAANYILSVPTAGEEFTAVIKLHGSTFGVTINAATSAAVSFGLAGDSTPQIRATLPGILGTYLSCVALSTARWLVTGHEGVSFSTAAA